MKALVIYDTRYGNTEQVANAIGRAAGAPVKLAETVARHDLNELNLVFIGCPTQVGTFTNGIRSLLENFPSLTGIPAAPFDTSSNFSPFGYAAKRIARRLEKNGGKLAVEPQSFVVSGLQGPLADGELGRAANWAKKIVETQ